MLAFKAEHKKLSCELGIIANSQNFDMSGEKFNLAFSISWEK